MSANGFLLAHDTGTGGDKAVLTNLRGTVVASAYRPYPIHHPQPEWAEQDPETLWQAVASTTRQVIETSGIDPARILGVGISAQMFNLLPVDASGRPLTPMISWLDLRSIAQADRVMAGDTPALLLRHTGNLPTAKDIIPKILWLKEERPQVWAHTASLLDCKEYLLHRLTGRTVTDVHGASVYFLLDPHTKDWSEEACAALGIPREKLPDVVPCTQVIGGVTGDAAGETGLREGTPVVACAGDVAAAQAGSGANTPGAAHLCIGTATWVGVSTRTFANHPTRPFWGLNHIDSDKWIIAAEMETGGGALRWFCERFCQAQAQPDSADEVSTYALLNRMAEAVPPGSDGLLFLPWLTGERAPVLDHYARAAFVGLSMGHTKAHLARAVMEGVGNHIRWMIESLEGIGLEVGPLRTIGGGSTSRLWTQIISDICGRELQVVEHPLEAGAIGAALTVAVGLGVYPSMEAVDGLISVGRTVRPIEGRRQARYQVQYHEYRALYDALSPIYRRRHTPD